MPKIRIMQLNERVATMGLHMGEAQDPAFRRKLEPGEVVNVDPDIMIENSRLDDPVSLFDMLWETGLVDVLPDSVPVTRPLDYLNYREGTLCSPSFNANSPTDQTEQQQATARVVKRLALEETPEPEPDDEDEPEPPPKAARGRRGRRTAQHGQTHTT